VSRKVQRRRYHRRGRLAGAQATRESIVQAARELFAQRGFAGTTIDAIAARADVAPQTVYAVFGSKAAIASEMRGLVEREAGIVERFQALMAEPDPERQMELVADLTRHVCQNHGDLYELFTAAKEPELAAVGTELLDAQRFGVRQLVARLVSARALASDLDPDDAVSIVCALSSVELYRNLVTTSGWSPEKFENWLAATLKQVVLQRPKA
jgi:AcrR family transcriptional regulator